jgi:hypothetical protein
MIDISPVRSSMLATMFLLGLILFGIAGDGLAFPPSGIIGSVAGAIRDPGPAVVAGTGEAGDALTCRHDLAA